jgi:allantoate deiminase
MLDVRHEQDEVRQDQLHILLERGVQIARQRNLCFEHEITSDQRACPMHPKLIQLLSEAVQAAGVQPFSMPSGAGHDAMIIAPRIPSAMLFLRSPGGISHHPDESVLLEDIALALEAGLAFLKRLSACNLDI